MKQNTNKDFWREKTNFGRVWIGILGIVTLIMLSLLLVPLLALSSGTQVTSTPDPPVTIHLRVEADPDDYVELTTEELQQFPALEAALQQLEASGGSASYYDTTFSNAQPPRTYLGQKYYQETGKEWNQIFKYGKTFYAFDIVNPDHGARVYLRKVPEPEYYVELTAEELQQFPVLQAALQRMEANGWNTSQYDTSERNANAPENYLARKYYESTGEGWLNNIFKYGENFYSYYMAVSDTSPQTSTQAPVVSEIIGAAVIGVLINVWVILSSYWRRKTSKT